MKLSLVAEVCLDVENVLYVYQLHAAVMQGLIPVKLPKALQLAPLLAQMEWGDNDTLEVGIMHYKWNRAGKKKRCKRQEEIRTERAERACWKR